MNKVYEIVTDKIIEQLNQGVIPWKQEWSAAGLPKNGISNKEYSGINPFLLMSSELPPPKGRRHPAASVSDRTNV